MSRYEIGLYAFEKVRLKTFSLLLGHFRGMPGYVDLGKGIYPKELFMQTSFGTLFVIMIFTPPKVSPGLKGTATNLRHQELLGKNMNLLLS